MDTRAVGAVAELTGVSVRTLITALEKLMDAHRSVNPADR
jgi:hypothetical protein